jgi:two-component system response regulator AtoC
MKPRIFVLDDDPSFGMLLEANLGRAGEFKVLRFQDPKTFLDTAATDLPDAVLTDLNMPGINGIEVTRRLREQSPHLPIFVVTAYAEIESAVEALKAGANDYLPKPINITEVTAHLRRALEERPLKEEAESAREAKKIEFSPDAILGEHPRIEEVRRFVEGVAQVPTATVLLLGESGTGKNLVAQAIHYSGPRASGRFVEVNCSAVPAALLEAELFGYMRGAFTDAKESKRGLVEIAHGGTLFLDEIGDLTPELQSKLLNFLESRKFRRLGGTDEITVDLRLITATNRDLEAMIAEGIFRRDLFYRIQVTSLTLPPLRAIRTDILLFCRHFLEEFNRIFRKEIQGIQPEAMDLLQDWKWPGNVRELRNVLERACIFCQGAEIGPAEIPRLSQPSPVRGPDTEAFEGAFPIPAGLPLPEAEAEYIRRTLEELDGSVQRTAESLGISRKNLWEKRKKYGLLS